MRSQKNRKMIIYVIMLVIGFEVINKQFINNGDSLVGGRRR